MGIKYNNPGCNCCGPGCTACPDHPSGPFGANSYASITVSGFPATLLLGVVQIGSNQTKSTITGLDAFNGTYTANINIPPFSGSVCTFSRILSTTASLDHKVYQYVGTPDQCTQGTLVNTITDSIDYDLSITSGPIILSPTPDYGSNITPSFNDPAPTPIRSVECSAETHNVVLSWTHCNGLTSGSPTTTTLTATFEFSYFNVP